jgi:iron(III) transport system substrate-binding protein
MISSVLITVGCGGGESDSGVTPDENSSSGASAAGRGRVVVYSGRNESLIGPLIKEFKAETGVEVQVRYAETAELTAVLLEEGENTPADLFISQDAAALGALSRAGRLKSISAEILTRVPPRFQSPQADWVGLSGRARAVVYNIEVIKPENLPQSLEDVADDRFKGRFGVAPTNGSFQAHMAVYNAVAGREALDSLLAGMTSNEPLRYPKNSAIVEAVIAGEVEWGLVNHYYLLRSLKENPEAPAANFYMPAGPASGFVNLAGAALLKENAAASELLAFLLSDTAQRYFAEETFEYPLVSGIEPSASLQPLEELQIPKVDFAEASEVFEETLEQITKSGLVG